MRRGGSNRVIAEVDLDDLTDEELGRKIRRVLSKHGEGWFTNKTYCKHTRSDLRQRIKEATARIVRETSLTSKELAALGGLPER